MCVCACVRLCLVDAQRELGGSGGCVLVGLCTSDTTDAWAGSALGSRAPFSRPLCLCKGPVEWNNVPPKHKKNKTRS